LICRCFYREPVLAVALQGRGAFRRFKDTLQRVGLIEDWYAFKHNAFVKLARDWCEENELLYDDIMPKEQPRHRAIDKCQLDMIIIPLHPNAVSEAANVLQDALNYTRHAAEQEIRKMLKKPNVMLTAIAENRVVGIIGAIPQYGLTGWELHPLAVLTEYQRQGVGSALVETLEREIYERGGVMMYLGSDDESGTTSLYGADLYDDTFEKIKNIKNTGGHPYTFYEKVGYKIVGVLPDANGIGKPDIWMAKRIRRA
jgi:aminoglycoside 6'-N-acetyltransferase I